MDELDVLNNVYVAYWAYVCKFSQGMFCIKYSYDLYCLGTWTIAHTVLIDNENKRAYDVMYLLMSYHMRDLKKGGGEAYFYCV